jgi:hypothetical protein
MRRRDAGKGAVLDNGAFYDLIRITQQAITAPQITTKKIFLLGSGIYRRSRTSCKKAELLTLGRLQPLLQKTESLQPNGATDADA